MASKTTAAEIASRVQEVQRAILQGFTRSEIKTYCKQRWKIRSTRTVHKYYNQAVFYDKSRHNRKAAIIAYTDFIKQFPNSSMAAEAQERLESLRKEVHETNEGN